jgi:alpha-mannosidase
VSLEFRSANLGWVNGPLLNVLKSVLARKSYRAFNFGLNESDGKKSSALKLWTMHDGRWKEIIVHHPLCNALSQSDLLMLDFGIWTVDFGRWEEIIAHYATPDLLPPPNII